MINITIFIQIINVSLCINFLRKYLVPLVLKNLDEVENKNKKLDNDRLTIISELSELKSSNQTRIKDLINSISTMFPKVNTSSEIHNLDRIVKKEDEGNPFKKTDISSSNIIHVLEKWSSNAK